MSDPFIGEIRMFGGNFAPQGWALCDGQLLAVSQNDALFSLLGTIYGGDGRTTFALPDLRGRLAAHAGLGPGLSDRRLGAKFGVNDVTLTADQTAAHGHPLQASSAGGTSANPAGSYPASVPLTARYDSAGSATANSGSTVSNSPGGNQSHTNVQPFQVVNFIIALVGIYPSRT